MAIDPEVARWQAMANYYNQPTAPTTSAAYNPMQGNPFVTVTQTASGTTYTPTVAATPQQVAAFTAGYSNQKQQTSTDYTSQISILKNKLLSAGLPASVVNASATYFQTLYSEGLTDDTIYNNYLYQKNYTTKTGSTIESPFYTSYGKFNDSLDVKKDPSELVNAVLGYQDIKNKYKLSDGFVTDDAITKYLKNNVSVAKLDERANAATLRGINADKNYVNALITLGYISDASQLNNFFMNPDIGQAEFERNRNTAAFTTEALRQANAGVTVDTAFMKKQAALMTQKGFSEQEIAAKAAAGFQNIANNLKGETKLSGIYQGANAATAETIQAELQNQEFNNVDSERQKMLAAQESAAWQGQAGTSGTSAYLRRSSLTAPTIGAL